MPIMAPPMIIQGGMGVAVSSWPLARAVARTGQLGVVSGTALDSVFVRRLQLGDPEGHLLEALRAFPFPDIAQRMIDRYYVPGGKPPDQPFHSYSLPHHDPAEEQTERIVAANFVEVYLAKTGHTSPIGINYLEKIQAPTLPSLFGAMLAGVDFVLMGAGIPRAIPGILDRLSNGEACTLRLDVSGCSENEGFEMQFDPRKFSSQAVFPLIRPGFLAIVTSATLASMLVRKATGYIEGFIVETPTAGGHNAPPRGPIKRNDRGEPVYGVRDEPDLKMFRELGRPFWLAGSYGSPEQLYEALEQGATGIQVGTAFAFCQESGLRADLKRQVLDLVRRGSVDVYTDPIASPTGFPFKIVPLAGSLSETDLLKHRQRVCNLGYLRHAYRRTDGSLGWRCPAEKVSTYIQKGGHEEDTVGRQCLCNALLANVGLGQVLDPGEVERPLITCGDDVRNLTRLFRSNETTDYSAQDVIAYLLHDSAQHTPKTRALKR